MQRRDFRCPCRYSISMLILLLVVFSFLAGCAKRPQVQPRATTYDIPTDRDYGTPARDTPATLRPYIIKGEKYYPISNAVGYVEEGNASWYGHPFHGRKTSNGETYNMNHFTAAHKTLPMNVYVRVTHQANGKSTIVRINDRGPFIATRIIDLSRASAEAIDMIKAGTAPVLIEVLGYHLGDPRARVTTYNPAEFRSAGDVTRGNFTLQIGAFAQRENANRYAERFRSQYANVHVVPYDSPERGILYRVRIGGYATLEAAKAASIQLENLRIDNFIVAE